jgi:hypothetical protein
MLTWDEEVKTSTPPSFASGLNNRLMDSPPPPTSRTSQPTVYMGSFDV